MDEPLAETELVIATVDHADIRGLVTTILVSVGRLLRSRDECWITPNVVEGCANTGAASLQWLVGSREPGGGVIRMRWAPDAQCPRGRRPSRGRWPR